MGRLVPRRPEPGPWSRFLDEAVEAGYTWIELGPYGYLPTDPEQLRDELGRRGLRLSGGAVFAGLHRGADALDQAVEECRLEARLLTALGARHLVLLPEQYTDMHSGDATEPGALEPAQWNDLTAGMSELGQDAARRVRRRAGLPPARRQPRRHPGAGRAVPHRHRPRARRAVPGHRAHLLLRRGQRRDHHALPRADRLRPPQAGRPGRHDPRPRGGAVLRRGRAARCDGRAAAGRPGDATAARGARRPRRRPLRDRGTGPVPVRAGRPVADRDADRAVPRRLRARARAPAMSENPRTVSPPPGRLSTGRNTR